MWDIIKTCTLLLLILLPFFTLLLFTLAVGGGRGQDGRDGKDGSDGKDGKDARTMTSRNRLVKPFEIRVTPQMFMSKCDSERLFR
jgi:hypothetical protein